MTNEAVLLDTCTVQTLKSHRCMHARIEDHWMNSDKGMIWVIFIQSHND